MSEPGAAALGPIVVGAGPVGLAAALALRARQLPVLVVEADPEERTRPGSRAIYVHRESLQLLDAFLPGLGHRVAAAGLVWPTRRSTFRGKDVYVRTYPPLPPGGLPPSTSLPQVETERILLAACHEAGVRFRWDSPVSGVRTSPHDVVLTLESGERLRAPYVVAADGARSSVRSALGIPLDGTRSESPFVIVDVAELAEQPMPRERIFHYEHPAVGGRNVLLVPFAGGWRVDLQCREDDDAAELSSEQGVRRWLARVVGPRYADRVRWVSTYRFLQVVAREFSDPERRVLLVGEAAHLYAPFGARGMNSGIADAASAAAAIRAALDSPQAARAAVEHFAADRRDAAEHNRAAARSALAHMQARDFRTRAMRRIAAAIAPHVERAGKWLDTAPYGPRAGRRGKQGRY
ncbi:MAG TPA: FAD-dependent monooxygenase [Actinomycetes bacterium]|jgi:3-(3-hydroxy-phenyl)propionate hydroxylase|nr:FAD-dependent monooxygenase [Actinomycetes bacterium]